MKKNITLKITGMHCSSCAMNIDGELEDSGKVISATTSYAKQQANVEFDTDVISEDEIREIIQKVGYESEVI